MDKKKLAFIDKEVVDLSVKKAKKKDKEMNHAAVEIKKNIKKETEKLQEIEQFRMELKEKVQKVKSMQKEIREEKKDDE